MIRFPATSKPRTPRAGRLVLAAAVACVAALRAPAAEYYVGDTGRTEKRTAAPAGPFAGGDDSPTTSIPPPHGGAAAPGAEAGSVKISTLYDADIDKALVASGIDRVAVQTEGVRQSLLTFSAVQLQAITGATRLKTEDGRTVSPLYAVLGMIHQNKAWVRAPILPVESAALAERMGLDPKLHNRISPVSIMKNPAARALVMGAMSGDQTLSAGLPPDQQDALKKLAYRLGSFINLPGEFRLAPMGDGAKGVWVAPIHLRRPELIQDAALRAEVERLDVSAGPFAAAVKLEGAVTKALDARETDGLAPLSAAMIDVTKSLPDGMPDWMRNLDHWNTRIHPFQKAAWASMLAFFAFLVHLKSSAAPKAGAGGDGGLAASDSAGSGGPSPSPAAFGAAVTRLADSLSLRPAVAGDMPPGPIVASMAVPAGAAPYRLTGGSGKATADDSLETHLTAPPGRRAAWRVAFTLQAIAAAMMILALSVRAALGGRMPVSNMYESITFAMGAFAVVGLVFEAIHRRGWAGIGASFFGWALMTAANGMPLHMRKVEPLVAVLNSVWLNFHVTSLLISYSAFLLAFVFGLGYLLKDAAGDRLGFLPHRDVFEYLAYRAIQVGWPLLAFGIFLGAVWANTAWGSYWSWDPKETWALITWFGYTIYLHLRIIHGLRGRAATIANLLGFVLVLVTYFGVSYLPGLSGGMHSYAEPIKRM